MGRSSAIHGTINDDHTKTSMSPVWNTKKLVYIDIITANCVRAD